MACDVGPISFGLPSSHSPSTKVQVVVRADVSTAIGILLDVLRIARRVKALATGKVKEKFVFRPSTGEHYFRVSSLNLQCFFAGEHRDE
jgi:hypothetical protein